VIQLGISIFLKILLVIKVMILNNSNNMTEQEKLRSSFKFWLMRKLWVKSGNISRWAGKRIVVWSRTADELDFANKSIIGDKGNNSE
jgi:hypothetical protein